MQKTLYNILGGGTSAPLAHASGHPCS